MRKVSYSFLKYRLKSLPISDEQWRKMHLLYFDPNEKDEVKQRHLEQFLEGVLVPILSQILKDLKQEPVDAARIVVVKRMLKIIFDIHNDYPSNAYLPIVSEYYRLLKWMKMYYHFNGITNKGGVER